MTTSELFLIALIAIFAIPWLIWRLGNTDYFAPLVVVQILAGILLGPGILGGAFPETYRTVFNPDVITALNGIAWWAVMLFVFVAGLELNLGLAWRERRDTVTTAACALAAPLLCGAAAAFALLEIAPTGWIGSSGTTWQFVLGVGMACAVTALPILVLFLDKLGILRSALGQRILRYASLDDVAIWAVLAIILLDWERIGRQVVFLAAFALGAFAIRWIMKNVPAKDRWYLALIWLAAAGLASDWSGLHYMVGAFLAGLVLDAEWFGIEAMDRFRETILLTIMPVFFLSTGLRTEWSMGGASVFGAAALFLIASVAGKLAGVSLAGRLLGWKAGDAWIIGWLLQTKALIMIIFVNILFDKQIITGATFTALLLTAVASTMLTIPFVTPALRSRIADKR